jgi:hypothetical protein
VSTVLAGVKHAKALLRRSLCHRGVVVHFCPALSRPMARDAIRQDRVPEVPVASGRAQCDFHVAWLPFGSFSPMTLVNTKIW